MTEVANIEPVEPTPQVEVEALEQINAEASEPLESSTDETLEEDNAPAETEKPVSRTEKRISQLTFEKYELERQKNAEIETLRQQLEQKAVAPAQQEGKPTKAQFDYDEDAWIEAVVDWKAEQKVNAYAATQAKQQQAAADSQAVTAWNKKREGYALENPEYLNLHAQRGAAVTSQAVASYLTSSEIGPKMHHELLENFEDLQRIQSLPEWQQGAELAKLETKLSKVKSKKKSNAPTPVTPVGSSSPVTQKSKEAMPSNW